MIVVLECSNEKQDFIYGTNSFHHIFEQMVNSLFGESDKEKFYPKVYKALNHIIFTNQKRCIKGLKKLINKPFCPKGKMALTYLEILYKRNVRYEQQPFKQYSTVQ